MPVCQAATARLGFAAVGEVAERSKALDWNSSNTQKVFVGSNPTLSATLWPTGRGRAGGASRVLNRRFLSMVARVGSSATISRKPRQARKGAAAAVRSGAGGVLARAATFPAGGPAGGARS